MILIRWLIVSVCFFSCGPMYAADRPNIVYIMADDMGYSDIGCYGSEINTPNLDRLAENGLRYTQFYNTARCCPTRASLLTGLYPHQAGVGWMMSDSGFDGYRGELNRNCVTLAEVLGSAGYRTYMSGKWHVTSRVKPKGDADKSNWPLQRGFDRFYGTIHGAGSFFDPNSLARGNTLISPYADVEYQPENGFYYTDAIADHAVRYVREHVRDSSEQPFFLYVAFTAAHWPMHAREEDIAKYAGRYEAGYEAIRAQRYQRMVQLGVIDEESTENWPMDPAWMENDYLDWDIHNMQVYAAMIDSMDQGIGRLIAALEETGQLENTLLMYLQDNGGCAEAYGRRREGQPRADKPTLEPLPDDYLQPDMQPKQTREGYPVRTGKGVMAGPADTYIAYGQGWATVSNTPFREYKHWVHEGGISSPLIAHWPAEIKRQGELDATPCHLIDLMATAVDLSEADYPKTYHGGKKIKPMEGKSLAPTFAGLPVEREALYWEHEGNRAVRLGNYKLVAKGADGDWELYNIAEDRSEQYDLSEQQPQRVKRMAGMWQSYAERCDVLPLIPYRKKEKTSNFNSKQLKFQLSPGDELERDQAPFIKNRGLKVEIEYDELGDGVLVAQGGTTRGWALYIKDQQLTFAVTQPGKQQIVKAVDNAPPSGIVLAIVEKNGRIALSCNGRTVAESEGIGTWDSQPLDGLQIGRDSKGAVGDYHGDFPFTGKLVNVVIELLP